MAGSSSTAYLSLFVPPPSHFNFQHSKALSKSNLLPTRLNKKRGGNGRIPHFIRQSASTPCLESLLFDCQICITLRHLPVKLKLVSLKRVCFCFSLPQCAYNPYHCLHQLTTQSICIIKYSWSKSQNCQSLLQWVRSKGYNGTKLICFFHNYGGKITPNSCIFDCPS